VRTENFSAAMVNMTTNLATELDRFKQRLKSEPQTAAVAWKAGSDGGGASDPALLLVLTIFAWWRRSQDRSQA